MNITAVKIADGSFWPAAGRWTVESPVEAPPLRFFRQVMHLRFETGGAADGIRVDPGSTVLRAGFHPYEYDAVDPSEPALAASLTDSVGTVIVTLDAPRQVSQVRLASRVAFGSSLELYRLDGETLSDNPTLTVGVEREDRAASFNQKIVTASTVRVAALPAEVAFTDRRFALRLTGTADPSLRAGDLTGLRIRGYPTGARIGISAPEDPGSATFFSRADGVVGDTAPSGEVDAGVTLAQALQRHLDDVFAGLQAADAPPSVPPLVDVALVVESDAPCVLDIAALDISYRLVRRSFPSREEKLVLRFAGGRTTLQEAPVQLPATAAVRSASLVTVESFGDEHLLAAGSGDELSVAFSERGFSVSAQRWVAQSLSPSQATSVSGVALALMAAASGARVHVELREDWSGQPSGRKLAEGEIPLPQVGRRGWATLRFPDAVALSSGPHWLLATAAGGGAVWLADDGDVSARVFEKLDASSLGAEVGAFEGLQAMHRLLSSGGQARTEQRTLLTVGEYVVEEPEEQDGRIVYGLTSAVGSYLDGLPQAGPVATVPLVLTSVLRGIVTVIPPLIEYDLEDGDTTS